MKKILVLDDEEAIAFFVKQGLSAQGYEVVATTDPDEAMAEFQKGELNLVVLDVQMPGKSGLEVYRDLKGQEDIPVLFLTGYPDSFAVKTDTVIDMLRGDFMSGNTDILYKPFDCDVLVAKVEALIGKATETADEATDEAADEAADEA